MNRRSKPFGRLVLATFALTMILSVVMAAMPVQAETDDVRSACSGCEMTPLMLYTEERTISANNYVTWIVYMEEGFTFNYLVTVLSGGPMNFYVFNSTQYVTFEETNVGPYANLTSGVAQFGTPLSGSYLTTYSGEHYIVLWNTGGAGSFEIQSNVDLIDIWGILELVCMVCVGIVVVIVVLIIIVVIMSRKKKGGRSKGADAGNVSYSLDDMSSRERDQISRYEPPSDIGDEPYKRDKFLGKRR